MSGYRTQAGKQQIGWLSVHTKLHYVKLLTKVAMKWFVTIFVIISLVINTTTAWQICHYFRRTEIIAKCGSPSQKPLEVNLTIATTVFDVLSDVLIVSIPVWLLWQVRIGTQKKIGLGAVLCLSVVMAAVALIRVGNIRLAGNGSNFVWSTFWTQIECNVAVWMVSMTAFRSFFVSNARNANERERRLSPNSFDSKLSVLISRLFGRRSAQNDCQNTRQSDDSGELMIISSQAPAIPRAMISGVRTAIFKAGRTQVETEDSNVWLVQSNEQAR